MSVELRSDQQQVLFAAVKRNILIHPRKDGKLVTRQAKETSRFIKNAHPVRVAACVSNNFDNKNSKRKPHDSQFSQNRRPGLYLHSDKSFIKKRNDLDLKENNYGVVMTPQRTS
ncbi:unnamed protein product [Clavelina lepadiformis]|uniref:Uncharacterized protein n=1 Tax=Clavelina lepadiformis TaxID=159417 RepID=A0ABP0F1B9_CLALP